MAITLYEGRQSYFGILQQAAFGTAADETSVAANIHKVDPFDFDADLKKRNQDGKLALAGRYEDATDNAVDTKGSMPKFTLSGHAVRAGLADFLYAFTQNVTEAETTPFGKTFTYASSSPDFTEDEGHFLTVVKREPVASRSELVCDAIVQSITLSCDKDDILKYSTNWVARGAVDTTAGASWGTWSALAETYWHYEDIDRFTFDFGSGAQDITCLGGWKLTLQHTIEPVSMDGSGSFLTYGISKMTGDFEAKTAWGDANSASLTSNLFAGTVMDVNIGWGHATPGTEAGDLDLSFIVKLDDDPHDYSGIHAVDVKGHIVGRASDETEPFTIVLADAVDRSW